MNNPSILAATSQSAILYDATTGRVLFQKQPDKRLPIASLTKIMTAIIAIENGGLEDKVRIGPHAVGVEGSSIYLKLGEEIPLKTLLFGLMLRSGNDAAVAIAEHIGGSLEGFVFLMNQKAEMLGLDNTHFMNPHGLDNKQHYSSARDLAILTAYALKNPAFQEIVKTKIIALPWPGEEWHKKFYNKNKMLRLYKWADGVKTGYTKIARRTLVSSATKNGMQLITVTLNCGNDWNESMKMFEYGFKHYSLSPLLRKGKVIKTTTYKNEQNEHLKIAIGKDFIFPLSSTEQEKITVEPVIHYPLKMVQKSNIHIGSGRIYLKGSLIGWVPLVSKFYERPTVFSEFKQVIAYVLRQGSLG